MIGTKKILITGSNGMLGSSLIKKIKFNNVFGLSSNELDITKRDQVMNVLSDINPEIIIHTAAFTNVESCEIEIEKAYKVNTIGTQNLVDYCIGKNILFVYISSTGVYGAFKKEKPYNDFDKVEPTTIHHKSKFLGEQSVKNHLRNFLIIRTGWLYGGSPEDKKNFVYNRFKEALKVETIYSDDSQIGNPTYVGNLCSQIELLIRKNINGVFNCVDNADNISRYDYVKLIIKLFGLNSKVLIAPEGMFKRIAPVSKNESAINYKLELMGINIMKNWEFSLKRYISSLKKQL